MEVFQLRKKHLKNKRDNSTLIIFLSLAFLLGITIGAIYSTTISGNLDKNLSDFFSGTEKTAYQNQSFIKIYFKYIKYSFLIWICGFFTPGVAVVFGILIFKGGFYGFTTASLLRAYGIKGILYAIISYLPQNIIVIPIYIFLAYTAIRMIAKRIVPLRGKNALKREKQRIINEYIIIFFISALLIMIPSIIEMCFIPFLWNFI